MNTLTTAERRILSQTWHNMKARCLNPQHRSYRMYGGRGITFSKEWLDFEQFAKDMGARPDRHSLERIDNNKGYSAENCKWATYSEQLKNRRKKGEVFPLHIISDDEYVILKNHADNVANVGKPQTAPHVLSVKERKQSIRQARAQVKKQITEMRTKIIGEIARNPNPELMQLMLLKNLTSSGASKGSAAYLERVFGQPV